EKSIPATPARGTNHTCPSPTNSGIRDTAGEKPTASTYVFNSSRHSIEPRAGKSGITVILTPIVSGKKKPDQAGNKRGTELEIKTGCQTGRPRMALIRNHQEQTQQTPL